MARQPTKVGMWQAIRDMAIAGINKGQGPVILLLILLIIIAARMSEKGLDEAVRELIAMLKNYWFLGWVLAIILVIGWIIQAKTFRRLYHVELDRVGKEKSKLQHQLAEKTGKGRIKSSDQ